MPERLKTKLPLMICGCLAALALMVIGVAAASGAFAPHEVVKKVATTPATVRADSISVSSVKLMRGEKVSIVGETEAMYQIEYDPGANVSSMLVQEKGKAVLWVDKSYVRKASESTPERKQMYSLPDTSVFADAFLSGDTLRVLEKNAEVTAIDSFANVYFLQLSDGTTGYASVHGFSDTAIEDVPVYEEDYSYGYGYSYSYSSGGGGGGSSTSASSGYTGGAVDTSTDNSGADGGDIDLSTVSFRDEASANYATFKLPLIEVAYADEASDIVLTDNLQSYLCWKDRGDSVDVVDLSTFAEGKKPPVPAGMTLIVIDDQYGYIPTEYILLDSDSPYTEWQGYTDEGAGFFNNHALSGDPSATCTRNQVVTVIDELPGCYVVKLDGSTGYMAKEGVGHGEFEEPQVDESYYDYSYSYSYYSSGGGGATIDAGNTGSSAAVIEAATSGWTDEVL